MKEKFMHHKHNKPSVFLLLIFFILMNITSKKSFASTTSDKHENISNNIQQKESSNIENLPFLKILRDIVAAQNSGNNQNYNEEQGFLGDWVFLNYIHNPDLKLQSKQLKFLNNKFVEKFFTNFKLTNCSFEDTFKEKIESLPYGKNCLEFYTEMPDTVYVILKHTEDMKRHLDNIKRSWEDEEVYILDENKKLLSSIFYTVEKMIEKIRDKAIKQEKEHPIKKNLLKTDRLLTRSATIRKNLGKISKEEELCHIANEVALCVLKNEKDLNLKNHNTSRKHSQNNSTTPCIRGEGLFGLGYEY